MSLQIKNTRNLVSPENFKFKGLVYAPPGFGKTLFLGDVPNIVIAACEAGEGHGLLTVAHKQIKYLEPSSLADLEVFCKGLATQGDHSVTALGLDSLSEMSRSFIKDSALAIPRKTGSSDKRSKGVPELDDYMVMGELTRRNLRNLLSLDKNIIVTATVRERKPDPETGKGEWLIGPDLPGEMMLGSTAMFDFVLCGQLRQYLKVPGDPKSRVVERYWLTQSRGPYVAKCRASLGDGAQTRTLLDQEEPYTLENGRGTFNYLVAKITQAYQKEFSKVEEVTLNGQTRQQ